MSCRFFLSQSIRKTQSHYFLISGLNKSLLGVKTAFIKFLGQVTLAQSFALPHCLCGCTGIFLSRLLGHNRSTDVYGIGLALFKRYLKVNLRNLVLSKPYLSPFPLKDIFH
jgi:hypothetical protein